MSQNRYYVTTPIYYVNGSPHLGHAYTSVLADAVARYQRQKGVDCRLLTGTDEHGQKVQEAAQREMRKPKDHCDIMSQQWKELADLLNISYSRFIRTTDIDHVQTVQNALSQLHAAGDIYSDDFTGWYSVAAERFWTEKDLVNGKCPDTLTPVIRLTEKSWFFRMSNYKERLISHIESHPEFIQPVSRRNEVLGFLAKDLGDLCISRPKSRMSWGIELPFDSDYVTYVWFDALLNYVSGADGYWPADVHFVGKDILMTHAIYWSTMLLALNRALPKTIIAHGWWVTAQGEKMSKSIGNVIDVKELADCVGVDGLRYFFLNESDLGLDGIFSKDRLVSCYNVNVVNTYSNFVHRTTSMALKWFDGKVPLYAEWTSAEEALEQLAKDVILSVDKDMSQFRMKQALSRIQGLVDAGNKYIEEQLPWSLAKEGKKERLSTVVRCLLEIVQITSVLQLFVMPVGCKQALDRITKSPVCLTDLIVCAREQKNVLKLLDEESVIVHGEPIFLRI